MLSILSGIPAMYNSFGIGNWTQLAHLLFIAFILSKWEYVVGSGCYHSVESTFIEQCLPTRPQRWWTFLSLEDGWLIVCIDIWFLGAHVGFLNWEHTCKSEATQGGEKTLCSLLNFLEFSGMLVYQASLENEGFCSSKSSRLLSVFHFKCQPRQKLKASYENISKKYLILSCFIS